MTGSSGSGPSGTVRVAAVQSGPASPDRRANLDRALDLLAGLAPRPDVVLFPELFLTPFWCVGLGDERYFEWAEGLDGPSLAALGAAARALGSYLVVPFFERGELAGQYFNSAALLGPDGTPVPGLLPSGERVLTYRKNAISAYRWDGHANDEKFYFRPGDGYPVFETRFGPIGILICYDRWFTEAWRVLALRGARIVFVPNASEGYVSDLFVPTVRVSAAQNIVYAVACNRAGLERVEGVETRYYGRSCIAGPRGDLLAEAPEAAADVVIGADLDLGRVDGDRRRQWIYRDRRPELYGPVAAPRRVP
jgi:beta-ureidopropionase